MAVLHPAGNGSDSWIDINKPVKLPVFAAVELVRGKFKKQHDHLEALKRRMGTRMIDSPEGAVWEEDLLQAEYELNPSYKHMKDRLKVMDGWVRDIEAAKAKETSALKRIQLEARLRSLLSQRETVERAARTMHDIAESAKKDDEDREARIDAQQQSADKLEVALENEPSALARLQLKFKLASAKRAKHALEKERDFLHKTDKKMGIDGLYQKILRRAQEIQSQRRFDKLERENLVGEIAAAEAAMDATGKILAAAWKLERKGVTELTVPLMKKRDKDTVFAAIMDAAEHDDTMGAKTDVSIAERQLQDAAEIGADKLAEEIRDELAKSSRQIRKPAPRI